MVQISAPLPEQIFQAGATVIVQAHIENAGPDLARISVLLDDMLLGEMLNPNATNAAVLPLTIDWPTSNPGQYIISVTAERADGSAAREDVMISVVAESAALPATAAPTDSPVSAPEQPAPPAEATATAPTEAQPPGQAGQREVAGLVIQPSNLRSGPSTAHDLVGSLATDQEVIIVAVDPTRDWYRITYAELGDAWIYSELVSPAGELSGLPVEMGPPPPVEAGVNLTVDVAIAPPLPLGCQQPAMVQVTVRNEGSLDTQHGGMVRIQAYHLASETEIWSNGDGLLFGQIPAGASFEGSAEIMVDVYKEEPQRLIVTVDSGNHIAETDENDNVFSSEYSLAIGDCA